jgi:hypothetical protein
MAPVEIEQSVRDFLDKGPQRPSAVVAAVTLRTGQPKTPVREALRLLVDGGAVQVTTKGELLLSDD